MLNVHTHTSIPDTSIHMCRYRCAIYTLSYKLNCIPQCRICIVCPRSGLLGVFLLIDRWCAQLRLFYRSIKNSGDDAFRCLLLIIRGLFVGFVGGNGSDDDVGNCSSGCGGGGAGDGELHQRSLSNICNDRVTRSSFRHASRNSSIVITPSWFMSIFRNTLSTFIHHTNNAYLHRFSTLPTPCHCVITSCTYLIAALPVILRLVRPATHQLVDGLHDVRQFGATDAAVTVQVIQFECPTQPLVHRAPQQRG